MIIGRPRCKTLLNRQRSDCRGDCIDFPAARETETAFAGSQSAKQTDESGREQRETNRPSNRPLPLHDQILPQIGEDNEIGPNQDLEIVPNPRRGFDTESENKDHGGAENEGDFLGQFPLPLKSFLPHSIAENPHQGQDQRYQNSKVEEPEPEKWHGKLTAALAALGPAQMKLHYAAGVKMIGD